MTEDPKEIKVTDRRRFDAEGKERPEEGAAAPKSESAGFTVSDPVSSKPGGLPEIDFSAFIMSLATQALMQLGEIPPPEGLEVPKDIAGAKQTIDILNMLKDKTKGNLESREAAIMENMLHNLRITFVRVAKPA